MDNYIVSARKYRPQTFESVVGQHALTQTLKNAIASGKLAHAYLFCGPRGVGKTTCARIFAKTINCFNLSADGEACNECESCKAFNENRSMNIFELDAASNNSINDIRSIVERVNIPPQIGRYKVFIIDEVHMLSQAAFNAFLKTLEEPPAHVIFIMATTEKHKVIPTILSRCQIYDFQRMDLGDIIGHLRYVAKQEDIEAEDAALHLIAQKADGGMRDALSIFDQVCNYSQGKVTYNTVIEDLNILDYEYYFKATDDFLRIDYKSALLTLNEILNKGFDAQQYIGGLASHFRNLLVARDKETLPLLEVSDDVRNRYHEQANRCNPRFLYKAIKICSDCDAQYRTSRNKRLTVELALIELAQIEQADADPSSGLGPTRRLKPLAKTATQKAQATPSPSPKSEPASKASAPDAPKPKPVAPQPSRPGTISRSISLKGNRPGNSASDASLSTTGSSQPTPAPDDSPFTEEEMRSQWVNYYLNLPQEESALQGRMKIIQPTLVGTEEVLVKVSNEWVLNDFNRIKPEIEQYFHKNLNNSKIRLRIEQVEHDASTRPITRAEVFDAIKKEYPAVRDFCNSLELKLY
ncbi:MAG: DNA polymerase III subunit gamma/tau [Alloprevotella sp.]|nr:DNA polymerase III subunit gamma/tau [Alloprevotella sp.]